MREQTVGRPDGQTAVSAPPARAVRLAALTALLAGLALAPLAAQSEKFVGATGPWKDSFYPYFPSLGNNFPLIALHFEERRPTDYFARTPYSGLITVDAGTGFTGGRMIMGRLHAPLLIKDWRFNIVAGATRESRFGYYGLGNGSTYDSKLETSKQPQYYRASRSRYLGSAEVTRHLTGPVYLSVAGAAEHSVLSDLDQPSLFRTDFGRKDVTDSDVRGRATLILDTRDNEFNTTKGIFLQGSVGAGSGGDGYSRVSADARAYVSPREGTVLAVRVAGSSLSKDAPLNARFEVPGWESETSVLGGVYSNRGLAYQRLAGRGVLLANAEVRHDLLNLGDLGAFTLLAFVDAGRVFEQRDFELTTSDMQVGGGGGLAIRLMRFTIWTFNFATGPDGFQFTAGSGWSF